MNDMNCYGQWQAFINIGTHKKVPCRQIVLPMPPSENTRLEVNWGAVKNVIAGGYYSGFTTRRKKGAVVKNSTQYNQWVNASVNLLKKGKLPKLEGEVIALVSLVFPDKVTRDNDNREKALFDAIKKCEHLIDDDVQISTHTSTKTIIKGKNFVLVFLIEKSKLERIGFEISADYLTKISEDIPDYERVKTTQRATTPKDMGSVAKERIEKAKLSKSKTVSDEQLD